LKKLRIRFEGLLLIVSTFFWLKHAIFDFIKTFNSDSAGSYLLGLSMAQHRSLVPSEFYYPNGDFPLTTNLVFALLTFVFGDSFTVFIVSHVICNVFLFAATYWLTTVVFNNNSLRFLFLSLVISGYSYIFSFNLIQQNAYGFLLTLSFLLIAKVVDIAKRNSMNFADMCIFAMIMGSYFLYNPIRSVVNVFIPLAALLFWDSFHKRIFVKIFRSISFARYLLLISIFSMFVLLRITFSAKTSFNFGVTSSGFINPELRSEGIGNAFDALFYTLGLSPNAESHVIGWGSIAASFMIVATLTHFLIFRSSEPTHASQIVLVFGCTSFAINFYLLASTNYFTSVESGRYLIIPLYMILLSIYCRKIYTKCDSINGLLLKRFAVALILIGQVISSFGINNDTSKPIRKIEKYLSQNGIDSILGTFWNVNAIIAFSSNSISGVPVNISQEKCLDPFLWITNKERFSDLPNTADLLLTKDEFKVIYSIPACSKLVYFDQALYYDDYVILPIDTSLVMFLRGAL
jgi:hypothetical protein